MVVKRKKLIVTIIAIGGMDVFVRDHCDHAVALLDCVFSKAYNESKDKTRNSVSTADRFHEIYPASYPFLISARPDFPPAYSV